MTAYDMLFIAWLVGAVIAFGYLLGSFVREKKEGDLWTRIAICIFGCALVLVLSSFSWIVVGWAIGGEMENDSHV